LRDEHQAKDVVQDVFIKLWEKRSQVESGNLAGYLFTMARNRILNIISHDKIVADYKEFLQKYRGAAINHTDHLALSNELETIIEAEIARLPPKMREVFMLSRKAWLSNKEIAVKLGLSEHTVADQIKKSLYRLRTKIATFLSF
jgi:RNA polymerase sigma-70 factor (ECF subfamily)